MPGIDKRELILLRMKAILDGVPGIVAAWRDRGEVPPTDSETKAVNLPALVLLDGTEDIKVSTSGKNQYGRIPATIFTLKPQIYIILMPQSEIPNTLGEQLSAFRISVYKAITSDAALAGLLGTSGGIEYRGSVSDMQSGGSLEGQMRMDFWLDYVFNPAEL
jgi:hypothetical protein